ncbi:hypothetical protein COY90_01635, partial [Candidatus Roizmanbacteria bacterium CG_4_10_14_0_8_um_filter_39_9]
MFERDSTVFFFSLFVGLIILFVNVPQSYAVGCNVACGGSVTCNAGLSCDAGTGLCKPPPPSCASAYPQSVTTNNTTGTFYTYAAGVANADSVYFPTWSTINGQDDLVWYSGTDLGGGTWRGDINLGTHSTGAEAIRTDVYMNNCGYTNVFCGPANFSICPVAVACPETCHTDTQTRPNGTCGDTSCPPNAPAEQTCASLSCHTDTQYPPDGNCNTHTCGSNAPPAVACPTYCGYPGGDVVPNGDCTTTTCPAVPDISPPSTPSLSSTTANCSGSMAFSWAPVTDNGCYG